MAERLRGSIQDDQESHLDLRPLLRLGGWGGCAVIALAFAVFAGRTDSGGQRAGTALASITGTQHQQALRAAGAEMLARAEAEREVRRTAEAVRILAADRDRLSQRLAALEHNLEDLTGSIKRQAERPPASPATPSSASVPPKTAALPVSAAPPSSAPPAPTPPATVASRNEEPPPRPVPAPVNTAPPKEPPFASVPAPAKPPPRPAIMALIQSYASSTATPEPDPPAPPPATQPVTPAARAAARRAEFAVDIGSSTTLGGLRALWERTRARHATNLANLQPLISVRDGTRPGSTELRLVVGPIVSAAAAARLCATLVVSGVPCRPAVFEGQRLALR